MFLIDNFYNKDDWANVNKIIKSLKFKATHQPQHSQNIDNRLKGYPCYESHNDKLINILTKTLKEKTELNIGFVRSAIRKIYLEELLECPLGLEGSL